MFSTMRPINGEYVNLAPVVHGKTESGSSKDAQYVVYDMSAVLAKAAYFPEGTASDTNCRAEAFGLTNELAGKLVNCFDTEDKCGPGFTSAALLQKRADALRDADVAFQQHAKTWREARVAELEAKLEEAKVELARIEKDLGVDENTEPQTFEDQAYLDGQRGLVAELTEQIAFFKAKLQQQPIDKPREPKFCIWGVFDDESKIGTDPPDHFVVNIRGSTGMDEWAGKLADFSSMWEKGIVQHSYETYDAMTPDWAEDADMYYSTGSALARAPSLVTETFSEYLWGEGKTSCPNFMRRYGPLVGTDAFKDPLCTTQHRCPLADEHSCIPKYRYACQILLSIESIIQSKTPILFVGHSLAGGLASIATIYSVTNAVRTGTPRTEAEVLYRALAWAGAGGVYPSMYWGFATADDFPMEKSLMVIKDNYDVVSHASFQGGLLAKYRYLPPNWKTEASSHVHSMDGLSELRTRTPDYTEAPCRNWQRRQYWFVAPGPSIDQIKQFCNGEGRHKICVRKKIKIGEPLDVMWNFENVREFREGDMGFIGLYRGHCSDMSLENTPRSYVRVTHHVGFHSFGAQWQYRNVFRFNSFFREPGSYCVAFVKDNLRGWKWLSSYLPGWRRDEKDYQLLRYRTVWVSEASLQRFKAPINPLSVSNFLALAQRLGRTKPKVKASETDSGSGSDTGLAATQTGLWVGASMSMYTLSADMSSFDDLPAIAEAKEDTKIRDLLYSEMEKPEPLINTPCDASGEFVLHDGACVSVKAVKDADQGEKEVNQPIRLVCTEGQTTEDVCALKLPDTDDGFDDNVWDEFRRSWKIHAKNVEPAQADKLTADWKQACEAANQWWSAQPDKTNPRKALLGAHRASSSDSGEDESGSDGSSSSSPPRSQQKAKKTKKKSLAPR